MTPGVSGEGDVGDDQAEPYQVVYVTDFGFNMESWKIIKKLKQRKWVEGRQELELEGYFGNPDGK